jgi:MFS family permease
MSSENSSEAPEDPETSSLPLQRTELQGPALRRAMWMITGAWVFGSVWVTATAGAPLTLFVRSLDASPFHFGLLSALPFIASLLSLPASLLIERTGQRKRVFLNSMYAQRLLWFPIALVPLALVWQFGLAATGPAMTVFLLLIFFMHACGAVGGPAWVGWMADVIPDRVRGSYFSRRRQAGILSAVPAALIVGWLLDRLTAGDAAPDPMRLLTWCSVVFMGAAVFGVIDIAMFHPVPEVPKKPQQGAHLIRAMAEPLRNRQFLWFGGFVAVLVFAVSFMGQFVTLYLIEQIGIRNTGVQLMLLVAPMLAQLLMLPVWGKAVDRMGKKPVLALASLGLVPVGLGWCLMTSGTLWLGYVLSMAGAMLWTGVEIANFNLVLEMSATPDENGNGKGNNSGSRGGTSYVAINSVIINIAGCLGGLSSGILAQSLQHWEWTPSFWGYKTFTFYEVLFAISGVLRLVAVVVFLPHIHEATARPAREALRFMTANIYNNLFNAVLQPVRYVRARRRESY